MIFVDSNIPMYLVGARHANKMITVSTLTSLTTAGERLVTDAEVFQEILHRYRAINRPDAIKPAFDALGVLVDTVFPIERGDVDEARNVLVRRWSLSSRDALHVAVMRRHEVSRVLTFDRGFDTVDGMERLPLE